MDSRDDTAWLKQPADRVKVGFVRTNGSGARLQFPESVDLRALMDLCCATFGSPQSKPPADPVPIFTKHALKAASSAKRSASSSTSPRYS